MDLIRLDPSALSIPLRFGGIVEGSEMLEIEGRSLKRNTDYAIDYDAGVIFLRRTPKQGASLRAAYRYDAAKKQSDVSRSNLSGFTAAGGMKLNIAQGTSFLLGMGMAERMSDGTVLSSNLYGLNNNVRMFNGAGKLKGLFVVSERNKVQSESLWEEEREKDKSIEDGDSQALVQGLETNFLGGKLISNVQDIREKFNGWAAFSDAGYDGKSIDELKKERGLKRYDYALQDVGVKGFKIRQGFKEVSDENGAIHWRNYGATIGPLSFDWQAQKVDPTFSRFNDLREGDKAWLGKEAGLDRQQLVGSLNLGSTKGAFATQRIESEDGSEITRRSASIDRPGFRASYSDQAVEKEFNRFGNVRDPDAGQLGKEAGLNRQNFAIEASPLKNQKPLSYAESMVRSDTGDFKSIDGGLGLFGIKLDFGVRRADPGFANLGSLSDAEINGHVASMTRFYDVNPFQARPEERNFFIQGAGIERLFQRLEWNPAKAYAFSYDALQVKENDDSIGVHTYRVQTPFMRANYREQDTGVAVDEWGKLLEYERQRLGTIAGLDKRNSDIAIDLPKGQGLGFSSMTAKSPAGDVTRITGGIKTKPLEFNYQRRTVDPAFENANQLADPEKDRLQQLRGWDEVEWAARLTLLPGLRIDAHWQDAQNMGNEQQRVLRNTTVTYQPDKFSELIFHRYRQRNDDPTRLEADYQVDRLAVCRQFDRWGTFRYMEEKKRYQGETLAGQPNAETKGWSYETKLLPGTAFKTEKAETKFENGDKETVTAHTLSAEIMKNAGVSVTDLQIQRDGEGRMDETKRNYGFWLDLAKGVRLSYGYVRNMTEGKPGEMQQNSSITPGTVGNVKIDAATYQHNQWDERRYQSTGALRVGTAKPMSFGDVKDFQFSFGTDSQRDNWNWTKEYRDFNGGFKLYGVGLGFAWKSQYHIPTGLRAIDRVWTLSTDQGPNSKLAASIYYKERSMPIGDDATVRNFNIIARPIRGLEIQHQLSTNPEEVRNDVILGSITKADRSTKWQVNFTGQKNIRFGLGWEELKNDLTHAMTRLGTINVTLFADSPSPLNLFYGLEHVDTTGNVQQTQHRYGIRFDQRPGPKQLFSFYASNLNYQYSRPDDKKIQNWTVRLEYQLKF